MIYDLHEGENTVLAEVVDITYAQLEFRTR